MEQSQTQPEDNALRRYRQFAGLRQDQLAESVGVSYQTVSNWERGLSAPDAPLAVYIARLLNTTVEQIWPEGIE